MTPAISVAAAVPVPRGTAAATRRRTARCRPAPRRSDHTRAGVAQRNRMRIRVRHLRLLAASALAIGAHALTLAAPAAAATPSVLAIRFGPDLEVNPVTKDYLNHQLDRAQKHYDAAVIELDTPGGLSSSLRAIYQKELALKVPAIVYVSPNGARAASARGRVAEAGGRPPGPPLSNIGSSAPIGSGGAHT